MEKIDLKYMIGLAPKKAIEHLKSKGYKFGWDWFEVWQEAHMKAFTVAKVMRQDILDDIREMVTTSLEEGITLREFQKQLEPKLKAKGWWGKVAVGDGQTIEEVQLGSPWRLKTIYRTNLQTSYMSGRYKDQMDNVDNRPYWQYVAVIDAKTRLSHRILNGKIFRYDDPFWESFYPPNGWGCRCRVRAFSEKNLQTRHLRVQSSQGLLSTEEREISKKTEKKAQVTVYTDPITLKKISPDVGWSYNPGKTFQIGDN
jgi:SPP1 gp7 family putative phage head morphogenesis protein